MILPLEHSCSLAPRSRRNVSSSWVLLAMPITANSSGNSFSRRRLHSAGTSRRLVRSPAAPKMTRTQGPAGFADGLMSTRGLGLDVPAELVSHRREQLVGEAFLLARPESGVERGRQ